MKGKDNFKIMRTVRKKDYFCPEDDHPVWEHFKTALSKCSRSSELQMARFEIIIIYPNISKTTVARICKGNARDKLFVGYDYVIEVSGDYWDKLDSEVKDIVMEHELEHATVKYDRDGNESYHLRDHDIKDFASIIDNHGIDWFKTVSNIVNDLNDSEEDLIIKI